MSIDVKKHSDYVEIFPPARFGYEVYAPTLDVIKKNIDKRLVFNLSNCQVIDSSGLGLLLLAHEHATEAGHTVTLKNVSGEVQRTIDTTNFRSLFVIEE